VSRKSVIASRRLSLLRLAHPAPWPRGDPPPARRDIDDELANAFERTVAEGHRRLTRTWPGLLATGAVGGIDVSAGVLGLLIVHEATVNPLLAALALPIGFIALTLAGTELFTENFLVLIAAVAARWARPRALARLWTGTAVTNLLGGWVMTGIIVGALPSLKRTAIEVAEVYPRYGIGWRSFALALLGGVIITLMTWMEMSTTSVPAKLVAASSAAPSTPVRRSDTWIGSRWRHGPRSATWSGASAWSPCCG